MRTPRIFGLSAVLTALMALLAFSCGKQEAVGLEVSVRTAEVSSEAGSMFVSVKCSGDWTLSLSSDDGDAGWASLNVQSGKGDRNNVVLTYQANEDEQERILTITAQTVGTTSRCTVTQAAYDGQQGGVAPSPGTDSDGNITKVTGWLELPAMDNPKLKYFSHSFDMDGRTYRNYSFGWSQEDLVALWVAYPLCKLYTNSIVSRTNAWAYDPLLGEELSSAPFGGYGGDYARGHQIPSADRLCSREANEQTFYGTNMTPQLNGHNEGIWSNLESKVRTLANTSDTTYVVTGCMVEGSTTFTVDSDGKKMTVPTAYFKAVLRYHKASTISQWAAAGFYTEHKDYGSKKSDLKAAAVSIDELERLTGLDFFVNLPVKLGEDKAAEIEAQDPTASTVWGW